MWGNRGDGKKERIFSADSIFEEPIGLGSKNVRRVLASVVDRRVLVSLEGSVQILIRERIDQEILYQVR